MAEEMIERVALAIEAKLAELTSDDVALDYECSPGMTAAQAVAIAAIKAMPEPGAAGEGDPLETVAEWVERWRDLIAQRPVTPEFDQGFRAAVDFLARRLERFNVS